MGKISIEYNPSLHYYKEIGYHKTYLVYKENIIRNGFNSSCDDDWLGESTFSGQIRRANPIPQGAGERII